MIAESKTLFRAIVGQLYSAQIPAVRPRKRQCIMHPVFQLAKQSREQCNWPRHQLAETSPACGTAGWPRAESRKRSERPGPMGYWSRKSSERPVPPGDATPGQHPHSADNAPAAPMCCRRVERLHPKADLDVPAAATAPPFASVKNSVRELQPGLRTKLP